MSQRCVDRKYVLYYRYHFLYLTHPIYSRMGYPTNGCPPPPVRKIPPDSDSTTEIGWPSTRGGVARTLGIKRTPHQIGPSNHVLLATSPNRFRPQYILKPQKMREFICNTAKESSLHSHTLAGFNNDGPRAHALSHLW